MSSTRTMYDKSSTANFLKSSRGPGFYQIDTPKECNDCFQSNPSVRLQKMVSVFKNQVKSDFMLDQ